MKKRILQKPTNPFQLWTWIFIITILLYSCQTPTLENIDAEALFAYEVYPILENRCFSCHGEDPKELEGDLNLTSLASLLKGGESGKAAIIPMDAENSPLYLAITRIDDDTAMPPKENDKLNQEEIESIKSWINQGAPWPTDNKRKELLASGDWIQKGKIKIPSIGGLSDSWAHRAYNTKDIWAFYPIKPVAIPEAHKDKPIDYFINNKLRQANVSPAPKAEKENLITRLSYDLTGLPPTKKDIDDFISNEDPEAFSELIDSYLASDKYGEQWARHWLDVVRYADSDGFSNDFIRPNAWRYRDYVIRAFNDDKRYDEFILEQIAGDEIDATDPENLIATGFLRMGPWEHTGMSVEAETRQLYLDDITNSVGEVFIAQPLRCARCHDHKFDPIPTKDVYGIQAVFATTQFTERPAPFLSAENLSLINQEKARVTKALNRAKTEHKRLNEKKENDIRKWFAARGKPYIPRKQRGKLTENEKPPRNGKLTFDELGQLKQWDKFKSLLTKESAAFEPLAFSVYNGPTSVQHSRKLLPLPDTIEDNPQETFILTGGSVYAKSDTVKPGVLSIVSEVINADSTLINTQPTMDIPETMNGRRHQFAKWLTHPDNPLVARTMVNRIWQYHFGKGIAGNPNNLGVSGNKPTHPELLDWLAHYFIENGWSVKKIHKLILSSEAWQRSSLHPNRNRLADVDPDNHLLAVFSPRRLDAEEIRDAMLMSSGELNYEMGGLPIRPEIHQEVALQPRHTMGSVAPAYQPSPTIQQRNRRTIYNLKLRGLANPLLEIFNQPSPNLSCERRSNSTVTPQVFMLFNDKFIRDRAIAIAKKLSKKENPNSIHDLFVSIYKRNPTEHELNLSEEYLNQMIAYHKETDIPKLDYPKEIERHMFEEMTGEPFKFTETLDVFEDYEPDLQMADINEHERALADLAVILFNSNEFIYVY